MTFSDTRNRPIRAQNGGPDKAKSHVPDPQERPIRAQDSAPNKPKSHVSDPQPDRSGRRTALLTSHNHMFPVLPLSLPFEDRARYLQKAGSLLRSSYPPPPPRPPPCPPCPPSSISLILLLEMAAKIEHTTMERIKCASRTTPKQRSTTSKQQQASNNKQASRVSPIFKRNSCFAGSAESAKRMPAPWNETCRYRP